LLTLNIIFLILVFQTLYLLLQFLPLECYLYGYNILPLSIIVASETVHSTSLILSQVSRFLHNRLSPTFLKSVKILSPIEIAL
jgi:hypothetical protein